MKMTKYSMTIADITKGTKSKAIGLVNSETGDIFIPRVTENGTVYILESNMSRYDYTTNESNFLNGILTYDNTSKGKTFKNAIRLSMIAFDNKNDNKGA